MRNQKQKKSHAENYIKKNKEYKGTVTNGSSSRGRIEKNSLISEPAFIIAEQEDCINSMFMVYTWVSYHVVGT